MNKHILRSVVTQKSTRCLSLNISCLDQMCWRDVVNNTSSVALGHSWFKWPEILYILFFFFLQFNLFGDESVSISSETQTCQLRRQNSDLIWERQDMMERSKGQEIEQRAIRKDEWLSSFITLARLVGIKLDDVKYLITVYNSLK